MVDKIKGESPDEIVRRFLKQIGRKGGKAKSAAKARAARKNARRPRKRKAKP